MAKKAKGKTESEKFLNDLVTGDSSRPERPKDLKIVSGGRYHDFSKHPVFQGHYIEKVLATQPNPKYKTKIGDLIGFKFLENGTNQEKVLTASHAIATALENDKFSTKTNWWIEFMEKKIVNKKPYNDFLIGKQ